ncbi:MAG: YdcH family protein [Gammaproteobacteria bacterium]
MLGEKHDLIHEFPEHRERIHELKTSNMHFSKLFDEYHELEHAIRRIEMEVEAHSDEYIENLKKQRLQLKDALYGMLCAAA